MSKSDFCTCSTCVFRSDILHVPCTCVFRSEIFVSRPLWNNVKWPKLASFRARQLTTLRVYFLLWISNPFNASLTLRQLSFYFKGLETTLFCLKYCELVLWSDVLIFPHSSNQIIVFWRRRCCWRRLCLNSLIGDCFQYQMFRFRLDILQRSTRSSTQFHTAKEHPSSECFTTT